MITNWNNDTFSIFIEIWSAIEEIVVRKYQNYKGNYLVYLPTFKSGGKPSRTKKLHTNFYLVKINSRFFELIQESPKKC